MWDNGTAANYRCSVAFDLRILDSAPTGKNYIEKVHTFISFSKNILKIIYVPHRSETRWCYV